MGARLPYDFTTARAFKLGNLNTKLSSDDFSTINPQLEPPACDNAIKISDFNAKYAALLSTFTTRNCDGLQLPFEASTSGKRHRLTDSMGQPPTKWPTLRPQNATWPYPENPSHRSDRNDSDPSHVSPAHNPEDLAPMPHRMEVEIGQLTAASSEKLSDEPSTGSTSRKGAFLPRSQAAACGSSGGRANSWNRLPNKSPDNEVFEVDECGDCAGESSSEDRDVPPPPATPERPPLQGNRAIDPSDEELLQPGEVGAPDLTQAATRYRNVGLLFSFLGSAAGPQEDDDLALMFKYTHVGGGSPA